MQQTALQASYKAFTDMQGCRSSSSTNKLALKHIMKLGIFVCLLWDRRGGHFFAYFALWLARMPFDEF